MKTLLALFVLASSLFAQTPCAEPFVLTGDAGSIVTGIVATSGPVEVMTAVVSVGGGSPSSVGPGTPKIVDDYLGTWWRFTVYYDGHFYTLWIGHMPGEPMEGWMVNRDTGAVETLT